MAIVRWWHHFHIIMKLLSFDIDFSRFAMAKVVLILIVCSCVSMHYELSASAALARLLFYAIRLVTGAARTAQPTSGRRIAGCASASAAPRHAKFVMHRRQHALQLHTIRIRTTFAITNREKSVSKKDNNFIIIWKWCHQHTMAYFTEIMGNMVNMIENNL